MPDPIIDDNPEKVKNLKAELGKIENQLHTVKRALEECGELLKEIWQRLMEMAGEKKS